MSHQDHEGSGKKPRGCVKKPVLKAFRTGLTGSNEAPEQAFNTSAFFKTPIAGSVKYGFKGVNLKVVFFVDVFLYLVKQITFQVDKIAAYFAFQVKMFLTGPFVPDILITGASLA
jgi:hypothetical protein